MWLVWAIQEKLGATQEARAVCNAAGVVGANDGYSLSVRGFAFEAFARDAAPCCYLERFQASGDGAEICSFDNYWCFYQ